MLDERGYAKLCDMGRSSKSAVRAGATASPKAGSVCTAFRFARFVINKTNTLAGTPEYMAPEASLCICCLVHRVE